MALPTKRAAYERLVANWRVATIKTQTVDEYGVLFRNLFAMANLEAKGIRGIMISSVVPPLDSTLREVCERYFNTKPLFVEPGVKTGMPVLYENPAEVGADRIVNAVAAFMKYGGPCVVVDFGTATTFDCVSARANIRAGSLPRALEFPPTRCLSAPRACRAWTCANPPRLLAPPPWAVCSPASTTAIWDWWMEFCNCCLARTGRGNQRGRDRRAGAADWDRFEVHQAGG